MSRGLLAGTASVTVDGTTYMVEGAFKYRPSTVKRETLTGMDGVHGYKETPVAGAISMSLRDAGDFLVATVNGMRNVTVVAQLANGKLITGSGMWSVDDQEVDSADAKFDVRFEGLTVTESRA